MPRKKINPDAPFQPISRSVYITGLSDAYLRTGCKARTIPHIKVGSDYRINIPLLLAQLDAESTTQQKVVKL